MSVSKSRLTVYFEPPFWVALYQREEAEGCRVCKITFGGEPRDQQVLDYFQTHFRELRFTPPVAGAPDPDRHVNPKRARREARKAIHPAAGTKAQQALQLQREERREKRKVISREQREAQRARKLALRREKRREKHKGH